VAKATERIVIAFGRGQRLRVLSLLRRPQAGDRVGDQALATLASDFAGGDECFSRKPIASTRDVQPWLPPAAV
jgi:hypothetical protein